MYRRHDFYDKLQWWFRRPNIYPGTISDIYDGELYTEWSNNGFLSNPQNISFSWYTDGIPVFKSSHISIWPFYLYINELPFDERKKRENTLLLGYCFDDKKPYMNNFIYQFREELNSIAEGVEIHLPGNNQIVVRGVVLMGVCDQPAKSDCFNFMLYNAKFGCTSCLSQGQSLRTDAGGTVHVYPYEPQIQLRTSVQTVAHGNLASPNEPVMGVKGNSALYLIMPDFIRGTAIDRMHCSDGGVIKKLLSLLFDAAYSDQVFSLRGVMNHIDNRLIEIKPPKFIHRLPRTMVDLKHWKASELKVFCFYYAIPLFEGIMRIDYFENFIKLIIGLYILSSDVVTDGMIAVARDLLNSFVREFEQLYGLRYCSINIHLLIHLPDSVKNLGPLWAHTCYESEDLNGQILKLFHGTWHIDSQLARSQSQFLTMIRLVDLSRNDKVKNFCHNKKIQVKIVDQILDHCYTVGSYKYVEHDDIPLIIMQAMQQSGLLINNITITQYLRLMKNNKLYVSQMYNNNLQTLSSVVQYLENNQVQYALIYCFIKWSHCICRQNVCLCDKHHFAIVQEIVPTDVFVANGDYFAYDSRSFLFKCRETEHVKAITVESLITPCFYMKIQAQNYIAVPINTKERE